MKYNSIIILGPTGSGKTELSLMLVKQLDGEIINADSMQIYKEFNIGTAKASVEERTKAKHHLIDFLNPTDKFSVSEYKENALKICKDLINNKKTPIIVGGTGFYIDSLLNNYTFGNTFENIEIRNKYKKILEDNGVDYLYELLVKNDYNSASKIHKNDTKRVIRALEINEITKSNKSEHSKLDEGHSFKSLLNPLIIGLSYNRDELYNRINNRVDLMIKNGLINEAKTIFNKQYSYELQSMQSIGYKELFEYFKGNISLDDAINLIKQNTRHYAKRQLTWFRRNDKVMWFNKSNITTEDIYNKIISLYLSE